MKARKQLVLSLVFFFSSVALWSKVVPQEPVATVAPPVVAAVASENQEQIEGVWEQYSLSEDEPEFMARLVIQADGRDYVAFPEEISPSTYPKHAYRSFDHLKRDGHWSFKEDWGRGLIGNFDLVQTGPNEYEGVALGSDGHMFHTKFVRVK